MGQDVSDYIQYFSFFPDTQVLFARKLGLYQGNVSGHMVGTLVEPESLGMVGHGGTVGGQLWRLWVVSQAMLDSGDSHPRCDVNQMLNSAEPQLGSDVR